MEMNIEEYKEKSHTFIHPFTLIVSGSTGSGKTEWIMKFLRNIYTLVDCEIQGILYCYGELNENIMKLKKQQLFNTKKGPWIKTVNGIPDEGTIRMEAQNSNKTLLLVLDDLAVGINGQFLDTIFTRGSHNWGVSVVLVTQHLFTKDLRTARNNSHYLVLMRNPAGALQIRNLAVQLFPTQLKYFMEAYRDATDSKNFSYFIVDMHPAGDEQMRLKTNIYADEGWTVVYVPKEGK